MNTYTELAEVLTVLGVILREARRARGLSQRAAAEQIGVSFSTVSRCESGFSDLRADSVIGILWWLDNPA